jgi:hypothetical protein
MRQTLVAQTLDGIRTRHVTLDAHDLATAFAKFCHRCLERGCLDVRKNDLHPACQKDFPDATADPAGPPGHDCDLS